MMSLHIIMYCSPFSFSVLFSNFGSNNESQQRNAVKHHAKPVWFSLSICENQGQSFYIADGKGLK